MASMLGLRANCVIPRRHTAEHFIYSCTMMTSSLHDHQVYGIDLSDPQIAVHDFQPSWNLDPQLNFFHSSTEQHQPTSFTTEHFWVIRSHRVNFEEGVTLSWAKLWNYSHFTI